MVDCSLDDSCVWNSRPLDVHLWSNYCEVDLFINYLWFEFQSKQPVSTIGAPGRPPRVVKRDALKVLLLDFYVCWLEDSNQYIGISSKSNHWSQGRYKALHLSKSILDILKWLVAEEYIEKREHYHNAFNRNKSRTARYRAASKLRVLFGNARFGVDDLCTHEGRETIILKGKDISDDEDLDSIVSLDYEDTPTTIAMREQLGAYNKLLEVTHVDVCSLAAPTVRRKIKSGKRQGKMITIALGQHNKHVRRIFGRGSWDMHGRFYGGWWQQIGSDLRSLIFINGNPTVEVDFKAMHMSILNAQIGADVVYDPYKVNNDVFPDVDRNTVREWIKSLVLTAINAKDRKSAYGAFRKNADTGSVEKRLKDHQLSKLLDAFIANHPHLTEFICSDQGIKLMYTDGRIAAHIIRTLTAKKIPVLAIHDSFIVERYHFAELRLAMIDASMKYCRRNLIAEQEGLVVDFSDGLSMRWRTINEQAVNKLPKHEPCEQYYGRFSRFCEALGLVPIKSNKSRGLMTKPVIGFVL